MCCCGEALVILFFLHSLVEKQKGISPFPRSVAADATSLVIRANAHRVPSLTRIKESQQSDVRCLEHLVSAMQLFIFALLSYCAFQSCFNILLIRR